VDYGKSTSFFQPFFGILASMGILTCVPLHATVVTLVIVTLMTPAFTLVVLAARVMILILMFLRMSVRINFKVGLLKESKVQFFNLLH
jgi:hypothetical protein